MRVGDVMATKVITTVHRVIHVFWNNVIGLLVLRLVHWAETVRVVPELELYDAGDSSKHGLVGILAGAVATDTKEALDFCLNDWPLAGVNGSLVPASVIVIDKELVFITSLTHGELGVNEEDGGEFFPVGVVNGLPHVNNSFVERSHIWLPGNLGVFEGSDCVAHSQWRHILNMRVIIDFSHLSLISWVSEIRVLALEITIIDIGVLTEWVLNTSKSFTSRASECSELHQSGKSFSAHGT